MLCLTIDRSTTIGIRLSYIDDIWNKASILLTIKRYRPSKRLSTGNESSNVRRASQCLYDWLELVLKDFDLSIDRHLFASVTDSGPDVKRLGRLIEKVSCLGLKSGQLKS